MARLDPGQSLSLVGSRRPSQHPHVVDQRYIRVVEQQAGAWLPRRRRNTFSSAYRSLLLEDRLKPLIKGRRKATLAGIVDAMG